MGHPTTVLVNPPLWNAYAPHLAVPLLVGTLRARGYPAVGYDLSITCLDWLLSPVVLKELRDKADQTKPATLEEEWIRQRGLLVAQHAIDTISEAKASLRSLDAVRDERTQRSARLALRNAMWLVTAAFPGSEFDLIENRMSYSPESTRQVFAATTDAERNPYRWAFERMLDWPLLENQAVGLVGVSVSADTQLIAAMTFLTMLRTRRPDVHIVLGGNFATRMVERWVTPHPFLQFVDTVLTGEGEESLPALVAALPRLVRTSAGVVPVPGSDSGDPADPRDTIPGALWRSGTSLRRTAPHRVDVRASAMPAFGDLPLEKYFAPGPILPVFASRSCAWDCAFCSIPFASNDFRQRQAADVVSEMTTLMDRHGTRYFMFVDEVMTLRTLRTVSEELIRAGTGLRWYGETRFAGGLTAELARRLYDSGCRRMNFGLESTSQRVLDLMRKGTKTEHIVTNIKAMLGAGIPIHLFVIHGFPGETAEEAEATVAFAENVARVSRQRYGVPQTTWGGSPFILDVHSPVGVAPSLFGITVPDPSPDKDLALTREYQTAMGLTQRQSHELARLAAGAVADDDGKAPTVWFRAGRDPMAREIEEFTFLRACLNLPLPRPSPAPAYDWPPPAPNTKITVSPDVVMRRLPWGATERDSGAAVALYDPRSDRFLQLNWPPRTSLTELSGMNWAEIRNWLTANECNYAGYLPYFTAGLLLRHGFLEPEERRRAPITWRWQPELGISMTRSADRVILTNPITGMTVRLNDQASVFWLRVAGVAAPGLDRKGLPLDVLHEEASRLAFSLAQYGILYRQALPEQIPESETTNGEVLEKMSARLRKPYGD